jgi:hypothetical protein
MAWYNDWIKMLYPEKINPDLRTLAGRLVVLAKENGLNVKIISSYRSYEEQNRLYAKGRTTKGHIVTNAKAGQSWHNFGCAVDYGFTSGPVDWDKLGALGEGLWLEWAGRWRTFIDKPHFMLTNGLTLKEARNLCEDGLSAVWQEISKRGKK